MEEKKKLERAARMNVSINVRLFIALETTRSHSTSHHRRQIHCQNRQKTQDEVFQSKNDREKLQRNWQAHPTDHSKRERNTQQLA